MKFNFRSREIARYAIISSLCHLPGQYLIRLLLLMKLSLILIMAFSLQAVAGVYGQTVSLSLRNAPFEQVIRQIQQQSQRDVIYDHAVIRNAHAVSVSIKNKPVEQALEQVFRGQPFTYSIVDNAIVIKEKPPRVILSGVEGRQEGLVLAYPEVRGRVVDSLGNPLQGASVRVILADGAPTIIQGAANRSGEFILQNVPDDATLEISYVGYITQRVPASADIGVVVLKPFSTMVDEIQLIGYGETTRRYNTGSVATISAVEIEQQPVTNVLSALSGRMAGVFVQTTNGLPGGNINIQIRGTGSITAGTQPLYIIDGVPFNSTFGNLTNLSALATNAINGLVSPLNSLNPNDIESISILKDADATAIYGSRGANGVVLINTKKGSMDGTRVNIDISTALNAVANMPEILSVEQYFLLREEAFANDNAIPSSNPSSQYYSPELTLWDRENITDWTRFYLGGTGNITNIQSSVNGGNQKTNYTISGNYRQEGTYLPGETRYKRGSLTANIRHTSSNNRFSVQFSNILTIDDNHLIGARTIAQTILLPPNYPVYNQDGSFNWHWSNPVAELQQYSKAKTSNLNTNLILKYLFTQSLNFSVSAGYNNKSLVQRQVFPEASLYPGSVNYTHFGNNGNNIFILEPQLNYTQAFSHSNLTLLIGGTYQDAQDVGEFIRANNFLSTALMENLGSASDYVATNNVSRYKYASAFGRATYNLHDKYILNASIRRDASSRFGPNNRIGHFGAIGAAWLFGEEKAIKSLLPFLSYGKLRGSYGTTGNDQISDYQYLSTYGSNGFPYEGVPAISPLRIANNDFRWESTRKTEFAIELGAINNRILLNVNRYINTSSNQLVSYAIPLMTGFSGYQANIPATIENKGWEFELVSENIENRNFNWTTNFNITLPKNTLREFENLTTSSYANTLVIGEDINRIYGYLFSRLNEDGLPLYFTRDGEETRTPSSQTDAFLTIGTPTPKFYGGVGNSFSYKNWTLDIFGQFAKQSAVGGLSNTFTPGSFLNNYAVAMNRWTEDNQDTNMPRASINRNAQYWQSSANFFGASYFRVKNIALTYNFHHELIQRMKIDGLRIYFQAHNVYTFWNRNSALLDPESGALGAAQRNLPPTQTFLMGLNITL